jgi:hypothetical protein
MRFGVRSTVDEEEEIKKAWVGYGGKGRMENGIILYPPPLPVMLKLPLPPIIIPFAMVWFLFAVCP